MNKALQITKDKGAIVEWPKLSVSLEAETKEEIKAQGAGKAITFGISKTPFGHALFGWIKNKLCFLAFYDENFEEKKHEMSALWPKATLILDDQQATKLASTIFSDTADRVQIPIVIRGTNFQQKVWKELLATKPSQLMSYSQLASQIGSPKAQRAVGSALAANTIGFLIPCHRVIKGNGDVGNYRWGSSRKLAMQQWEAELKQ